MEKISIYDDEKICDDEKANLYNCELNDKVTTTIVDSIWAKQSAYKKQMFVCALNDLCKDIVVLLKRQENNLLKIKRYINSQSLQNQYERVCETNTNHIEYVNLLYEGSEKFENGKDFNEFNHSYFKSLILNEIQIIENFGLIKKFEQNSKVKQMLTKFYNERFDILRFLVQFLR